MTFQASEYKERHFLDLNNNDNLPAKPTYTKGGTWLNLIGHSNTLCARVTRAIMNHAPTGEYQLRFFPREPFACSCGEYPIKSRNHILHNCRRYNKYWNPNRESLKISLLSLSLIQECSPSMKELLNSVITVILLLKCSLVSPILSPFSSTPSFLFLLTLLFKSLRCRYHGLPPRPV